MAAAWAYRWRPARRTPVLLLASLACPLWAHAGPAVSGSAVAPGNDPASWVERIRAAAQQRSYVGTLVVAAGEVVSSSRVARFGSGEQAYERIEALDGRQQRSVRHNGLVHTVWPAHRLVTIERRTAMDEAVGLPELDPQLQTHYELRVLGPDRLAGRDASVLLLKPKDELRFAQRLWADQATGLLLRADVLSAKGQVLESSAFSDVEIDARPSRDSMPSPLKRLEGYRVVQIVTQATSLEAEGWTIERLPAGFRLLGCVRRPVGEPVDDPAAQASRAVQAVFSDGLARVSIFVEAADPARLRQALMTHMGATHTLIKPRDERWWITVMGDVPMATLKVFVEGLVRRP